MYNERTINMKLKRIDICDLLLACTFAESAIREECEQQGLENKWTKLHDKIQNILEEWDAKHGEFI